MLHLLNVKANFPVSAQQTRLRLRADYPPRDILAAWALLYQRQVQRWKPTSAAAVYWYDAGTKMVNRYDSRGYHDQLVDLLPIAALKKKLGSTPPRTMGEVP